jgi:hypothetical protein
MSSLKKIGGLQFHIRPFTKEDADLDAELAAEKSNDVVGFLSPQVADIYNWFTGNTPQTSTSDQLAAVMQRVANNPSGRSRSKPDLAAAADFRCGHAFIMATDFSRQDITE